MKGPDSTVNELIRKRKQEDLEICKLEEELIAMKRLHQIAIMTAYSEISRDPDIDDHARSIFKDNLIHLVTQTNLSNVDEPISPDEKPLTISMVADDMGYIFPFPEPFEMRKILKKLYVERYDEKPPQEYKSHNGRLIKVNLYTEADRDIIKKAIQDYLDENEQYFEKEMYDQIIKKK